MMMYQQGDASAFEVLYSRHKGPVYRFVLRQCNNQHTTDELFQDIWMKLIQRRERKGSIYEVALVGGNGMKMDPLRYQPESQQYTNTAELAFLRLRYKAPESDTSQLLEWNISKDEIASNVANTSTAFRFAAAVAAFGQKLRGGEQLGEFQYRDVFQLAQTSRGNDPFGYRGEFISLVNLAESLTTPDPTVEPRVGLMK